ncbi:flagellin lysine-N-methylase [Alteromonas sp. S015]|uniref:flagellin lysine-N-methylase n=1 Tax=Alteromonas sp. S015 TaxID=3117401 RepID=UPI002FE1034F
MNKLIPEFFSKFQCIGPQCEASCCTGWKVSIDKKTYKTYKKSKNTIVKKIADKDIALQRTSTQDWARIKLDSKGACPALNEEKLCNIHIELGEKHLSEVCRTYPRLSKTSDSSLKMSLTLSCPEAVRQVLFNPSAMNFRSEPATDIQGLKRPVWFNRIHYDMIEIAASDQLSIDEKLFAIGLIVEKLPQSENIESLDQINHILDYSTSIKTLAANGQCREQLNNVDVTPQFHGKFLTMYLSCLRQLSLNQPHGRGKQKIVDLIELSIPNIDNNEDGTLKELHENIRNAWTEICVPYLEQKPQILVNLLIYLLYERDFPLGLDNYTHKQAYLQLVADFTYFRGLMASVALAKEALCDQDIVDIVYTYTSITTHSTTLQKVLLELFDGLEVSVDVAPLLLSKF